MLLSNTDCQTALTFKELMKKYTMGRPKAKWYKNAKHTLPKESSYINIRQSSPYWSTNRDTESLHLMMRAPGSHTTLKLNMHIT